MGAASFQRGMVVRIDGSDYRLLRQVSNFWQLENIKTGRIVEHECRELLQLLVDSKLVFVIAETVHSPTPVVEIPKERLEIAKVRLMYVRAVLGLAKSRKTMEPVIVETWDKCKQPGRRPGWITVYRWAKRYLEALHDIRALVDSSCKKGNRTSRFPREVTEICKEAIEKVFMTPERPTVEDTLNYALLRVREENQQRPTDLALPLPTRRLIRRLIGDVSEFDKCAARYGRDEAVRRFRSVTGYHATAAPLERAQIDHTILDFFVVDDRTCLPLGRPYLTACEDDFSRCILGVYIGFVPPSCLSISRCLKDAFLPKLRLKDEYPSLRHDWTAYGVMRELVLDNGLEFHSNALEQMCLSLGIVMTYCPPRQAWFKGKIERFFKTVNDDLSHKIPGTSFSNIFERGDYKPREHAVVRLSTLDMIVRKWVCDVYHQRSHSVLHMSPAQRWTSSILPEDIHVPFNVAELDLIMGRPYTRTLSHKGIELDGLFYNSPELSDLRCRGGATLKVDIRVDEGDMGHIFVMVPDSRRALTVPALHVEYANGMSRWQHGVFRQRARETERQSNPLGWMEAKEEIAALIEQELIIRRKTSSKRVGRYLEETQHAPADAAGNRSARRRDSGDVPIPDLSKPPALESSSESVSEIQKRPVVAKRFRTEFQKRASNA